MTLVLSHNNSMIFLGYGWINCCKLNFTIENLSQPHFGISVRVKPTLPKVGSWSLSGLPKTQSSISGVKSPRIRMFVTSLERS
jgi:hypothetical protein